jgi:branched-chain amino acid transport system substrate-binding protein
VLGAVRAPLNTSDYSSFLIQARASGAKVVGMALAGTDMQKLHQAGGGVRPDPRRRPDREPAGAGHRHRRARAADLRGMVFTDSFYWDMTEPTRAWSRRYMAR